MEITLPAKAQYLSLLRLILAAVCRQTGMNEDAIDDLKLAVTEVFARAIDSNLAEEFSMKVQPNSSDVRVTIGNFTRFDYNEMFPSEHFTIEVFKSLLDDFKTDKNENSYYAMLVKKADA